MQSNKSIMFGLTIYYNRESIQLIKKSYFRDKMVKRLLRSLPKSWRSTMVAIRKAKDLNKISLDEICGSLLTYEQEVNQIDEEGKK